MKLPLLCAAALVLGLEPAAAAPRTAAQLGAAQDEPDDATRFFALPMVRDTRELAAAAEDHLRAERFTEAMLALQRILDEHAHEVLPPQRNELGARATYPGAAEWALERLFALPPATRAEYQARHEPRAAEALARARLASERSALTAIPRRWPLAPSAVRAWWALGDLERESGQHDAAELAWRRAVDLGKELGLDDPPAAARVEWLAARAAGRAPARRTPVTLPRADAQPWTRGDLDLTPFAPPYAQRGSAFGRPNLLPAAAGGVVLVCSTLRMYAVDAYTGELRWEAGPPAGWTTLATQQPEGRLFQGINYQQLLLAPAAGAGVALGVMQEPFSENDNEDWQGIEIMKAIPERRLHAYDIETGRELWNHAPKLRGRHWDGTGTYAQRMMVAGSPVVAGARVLVPCYRMQGRIDYHVACYELTTGELLWSTQVISGQRERNMFGRSVKEFCASPLVVEGERVVAQTELGTLAALDLFSGRILWQTTYKQIDLPKTRSYHPPQRQLTWDLAPPAVVGDVIVATPSDSRELVAVRLSDGGKLWAWPEEQLQELHHDTELLGFDLLVGADHDMVYLSGQKLSALQKPGGLATSAPFFAHWTQDLKRPDTSPRALLCAETIIAPNTVERAVHDRRTGTRIAALSGSWNRGEAGNLAFDEGALFSLSLQGLSGYFDWLAQLERARTLAATATDDGPLRTAAELFQRRGTLLLLNGALDEAHFVLREARTYHERLRALQKPADARSELACLRALAECLAGLRREEEALAVLSEAKALASGPERAELLFEEERVLRARGGAPRIALLDEIEACCGALPLPDDVRAEAVARWLGEPADEDRPARALAPLPTALWVALERADERERAGELAPALEDLHAGLELADERSLVPGTLLADLLRERVTRILHTAGGRTAYAPIEERAAALLLEAEDDADLEAVAEHYPHSSAADQALGQLIERAADARDAAGVARLVRTALERGGLTSERETEFLLHLARALGDAGNGAFERALVAALATADPARVSPVPAHGGVTLAALAADLAKDAAEPTPAPVLFDQSANASAQQLQGVTEYLGALRPQRQAPESPPLELHLYATRQELHAYASSAPGKIEWKRTLDGKVDHVLAPGRLFLATRSALTCVDEHNRVLWAHPAGDDPPRSLAVGSGVLVVQLRSGLVLGLDAHQGLPLWEKTLGADDGWTGPLVGGGHATLFSQLSKQDPRVLALDLFRGRVTADFRVKGLDPRAPLQDSAWIDEGRLIVPSFQRPAQISAFALDGGKRAWTVDFARDEELHSVVTCEGRVYPVTLAPAKSDAKPGQSVANGGVYELDDTTVTLRRIVPLNAGEALMGVEPRRTIALPAPYLFTYAHTEGEANVGIRVFHLPHGLHWRWTLSPAAQEFHNVASMPMPAVSADCVAVAYQVRRPTGGGSEATIVFLDKRGGEKVDTLDLGSAFARATRLELRGLGDALFVLGRGTTPSGACLDILEPRR